MRAFVCVCVRVCHSTCYNCLIYPTKDSNCNKSTFYLILSFTYFYFPPSPPSFLAPLAPHAASFPLSPLTPLYAVSPLLPLPPLSSFYLIRCAVLRFTRLHDAEILSRLLQVCSFESINYDMSGLESVIFTAEGDMRNALNALQVQHASSSPSFYQFILLRIKVYTSSLFLQFKFLRITVYRIRLRIGDIRECIQSM